MGVLSMTEPAPESPRPRPSALHLQQLLYLRAVARYGSLTQAAEQLGLTQSALSHSLGQLERRLDVTLFDGAGRRRSLTQEGHEVLRFAERVLADAADLDERLRGGLSGARGRLAVGAVDAAALHVLPEAVRAYRRAHPGVELTLAVENSSALLRRLRSFELDLAFVIGPVEQELAPVEIRRDPLHVYAPPGPWQELDEAEWILYPAGSRPRRIIDEGLARLGISPRVAIESNNPEVLRQLVSLGFGWSVLPSAVVESGGGRMEYARGVQVAELPLMAARPPGRTSRPRADAFMRLVLDLGRTSEHPPSEPRRPRSRRIATHADAERFERALMLARRAEARSLWEEAAEHYGECLLASEAEPRPAILDEFGLRLARGVCLRNAAQWRPAWRELCRAFDLGTAQGDGIDTARAALELTEMNAPHQRRNAMAEQALGALGDRDPVLRARLLAWLAEWDQGERGRERAGEAVRLAEANGLDDVTTLVAATHTDRSLYRKGDVILFGESGRRAHSALAAAGRIVTASRLLLEAASAEMWGGHLAVGERTLLAGYEFARNHRLAFYAPRLLSRVGNIAFARCDWDRLDAIIAELGAGPDVVIHPHAMALAELRGEFDETVALMPDPEAAGNIPAYLGYIHGARARVLTNAGRLDEARQELIEWYRAFDAQPGMRRDGDLGSSTLSEVDTAVAALGDETSCRELYEEFEARPWARFGGRGYDVIRGALAERLGMPAEAERHYVTGRDWAARERLPVEEARCLLGLARLARASGDGRAAVASARRAAALLGTHGAELCLAEARGLARAAASPGDMSRTIVPRRGSRSVRADRRCLGPMRAGPRRKTRRATS